MAFGKPIIVGKETLAARRVEAFGNGVAVTYGSKEGAAGCNIAVQEQSGSRQGDG